MIRRTRSCAWIGNRQRIDENRNRSGRAKYSRSVASRIIVISQASSSVCRAFELRGACGLIEHPDQTSVQRPAEVVIHPCPSLSVPPMHVAPTRTGRGNRHEFEFALSGFVAREHVGRARDPGAHAVTGVPGREAEAARANRLPGAQPQLDQLVVAEEAPADDLGLAAPSGPLIPIATDSGRTSTSTGPWTPDRPRTCRARSRPGHRTPSRARPRPRRGSARPSARRGASRSPPGSRPARPRRRASRRRSRRCSALRPGHG